MQTDSIENLPVVAGVVFKIVPGFEELAAGDDGSIWTCLTRVGPRGAKSVIGKIWRQKSGTDNGNGYLRCGIRGKTVYIHDLILLAFKGQRPDGFQCCHADGNKRNNKPENLRWGSSKSNHADRIIHGTNMPGELNPRSKLTEDQVIYIRSMPTASLADLAAKIGTNKKHVWAIRKGLIWKHVSTKLERSFIDANTNSTGSGAG